MSSRRISTITMTSERWLAAAMLSLLLVTQWMSLSHAIAHATPVRSEAFAAWHAGLRDAIAHRASSGERIDSVAAHHDDGSPLCRLLDHLGCATPVVAITQTAAQPGVYPRPGVARIGHWSSPALCHYSARAPPLLS